MASERVEAIVDVLATGLVRLAKWALYGLLGMVGLGAALFTLVGVLSTTPNPFPETDLSTRKPYVDFIGREYRLIAEVDAIAWNDFPDKAKILVISLMPRPNVQNRFVSYKIPLKAGQTLRIRSATGRFGSSKHYVVSVPRAGLPEGIPVHVHMESDGSLDPLVYEPVGM